MEEMASQWFITPLRDALEEDRQSSEARRKSLSKRKNQRSKTKAGRKRRRVRKDCKRKDRMKRRRQLCGESGQTVAWWKGP